jgi:hypothetical protein
METITGKFGVGHVITAGILGGILFASFELIVSAVLGPSAFKPIQLSGAIVLGPRALEPGFPLYPVAIAAGVVHIALSIAFVALFAVFASPFASESTLTLTGIGFGVLLWLVNIYVIAPIVGWYWFPDRTNPIVQFIAHAFFFGCPAAWLLAQSRTLIVRPS